jgi:type III secretory pathway component EscU
LPKEQKKNIFEIFSVPDLLKQHFLTNVLTEIQQFLLQVNSNFDQITCNLDQIRVFPKSHN